MPLIRYSHTSNEISGTVDTRKALIDLRWVLDVVDECERFRAVRAEIVTDATDLANRPSAAGTPLCRAFLRHTSSRRQWPRFPPRQGYSHWAVRSAERNARRLWQALPMRRRRSRVRHRGFHSMNRRLVAAEAPRLRREAERCFQARYWRLQAGARYRADRSRDCRRRCVSNPSRLVPPA